MNKIAIFADVQNIYYTTREAHNAHFDYSTFWEEVTSGREVVAAIAYAIDRASPKQMAFQQILRGIGFEVKLKPFIRRRDGSSKGDWDVGITLDLLEYAPQIDVAILAAAGRGNIDGEPIQGSLAQFVAQQVELLDPQKVLFGHHDDWLPGFSIPVNTGPIIEEIRRANQTVEVLEPGYLEGTEILP